MRATDSPSENVKSPASIVKAPCGPRYGRPSDQFGPPTALFSPELALLKYDLGHLDAFMPDSMTADLVFNLIENATNFFDHEFGRRAVLRPILRGLLGLGGHGERRIATTDGTWLEETFGCPIIKINDEPGRGGDPFLQGLVAYSEAIAQEKVRSLTMSIPSYFNASKCHPFLDQSNLPVVLLAIAGNRLIVSTAVYTDSIYADELLSVSLRFGSHAADNALYIGRVFMAIKRCMERLSSLYRNLRTSTRPTPAAKVLWPNPTSDPPGSIEGIPELEFFCKVDRSTGDSINQTVIDEENKRHAMYLARMRTEDGTSTTEVFVKFAVTYNATAHRLLANHKPPLAPALHSCTRVIGDMFMVVMEYLPGTPLLDVWLPIPASVHEAIRRDVPRALELLHEQDLVFGDLREGNLLYLPEDGGRILLVDFDRVGRDGKDRYSACLNPDAELGVKRLQIMEKSHDTENFGRLVDRFFKL